MKDSDRISFYIEFKSPASHELHFRTLKEFFDKPVKSPDTIFKKCYPCVLQEKKIGPRKYSIYISGKILEEIINRAIIIKLISRGQPGFVKNNLPDKC